MYLFIISLNAFTPYDSDFNIILPLCKDSYTYKYNNDYQ